MKYFMIETKVKFRFQDLEFSDVLNAMRFALCSLLRNQKKRIFIPAAVFIDGKGCYFFNLSFYIP